MKGKKVIVSVTNDLFTDNRVDKVCNYLQERGAEVVLVGRKLKKSKSLPSRSYQTHRFRLPFEKGALFYASYNLRLFFFLLFNKFDVLVANDLDVLLANFLAHKLKKKSKLIYDTHELFTEVPELVGRPKVRKVWLSIERFIFPKLNKVITVNDSIAQIYRSKYQKEVRVVRNVSRLWSPDKLKSKEELGLPIDKKIVIIQGAGINVDRGAEEAVTAFKEIENAILIIVGDGDVLPSLKSYVQTHKLEEKVLFFGKLPYQEMMNYTYHADIGLTLDKNTNPNYEFSLPNKVFDYIHAGTAVIATDLIEVKKVVLKHNVGVVIPVCSVEQIKTAIEGLINDESLLNQLKNNCKTAAKIENWEAETKVLDAVYDFV